MQSLKRRRTFLATIVSSHVSLAQFSRGVGLSLLASVYRVTSRFPATFALELRSNRLSFPFLRPGCDRFKGDKNKGPAKQRVRDDSAKPQISEVKASGSTSRGKASSSTGGGDRGCSEALPAPSKGKGKGSFGQAASTLPVTSLTWTTTVRT